MNFPPFPNLASRAPFQSEADAPEAYTRARTAVADVSLNLTVLLGLPIYLLTVAQNG